MAVVGKYLAGDVIVTADGTQSFVPGGHGYDEFIAEAEANGDTIEAYVAPPAPFPDLLPYQFRAMLALSGKQADLDAYIAGLSDPAKTIAQAKLDYSLAFQRDNDLVLAAQSALGLTDDQLDALWEQAAQIA